MKSNNILLGVFMALFLLASSVSAIPHLINFEGKLSNSSGSPLTGDYTMVFTIYNASAGGTALWSETYNGSSKVHAGNGVFNVLLGSRTTLNLTFDKSYYLGIKVENDDEMMPRQPLASVGYAYRSEYCEMGDSDWTISGNNMSSGVSGNVGIGTTNPSAKLDVYGNTNIEGWLNVYKADDRNKSLSIFWDPWVAYDWVRLSPIINTGGAPLIPKFTIQGNPLEIRSEKIILNGSVGIGTTDPQGYKFAVNGGDGVIAGGKLRVQTVSLGGSGGYYAEINGNEIRGGGVAGPGNNPIHIKPGDNQSAILLAEDGGNVGIGTTTPTAKLEVNGSVKFGCPLGMTKVGSFCMDQYEASVWQNADCTGTLYGGSDDYPWLDNGNDFAGYACSKSGVLPSAYITWFQAQQACGNSGKRLCTNAEWQMAAAGTPDDCGTGACHCEGGGYNNTGSYTSCKSRWNVYDMNGNLWEWVADWSDPPGTWSYGSAGSDYGNDYLSPFSTAFFRGGGWGSGAYSGVFALIMDNPPSYSNFGGGFRCCQ